MAAHDERIYYWDHAVYMDRREAREISSSFQTYIADQRTKWDHAFYADWDLVYKSHPVCRVHVVVRQGAGVPRGAHDPIVAHALVVFVTEDFIRFVRSRENRKVRTSLAGYQKQTGRSPILTLEEVRSRQASSEGSNVWSVFLHFKQDLDSFATLRLREQLVVGLRFELRKFNIQAIFMEALSGFREPIMAFGLQPVYNDLVPLSEAELREMDRLFPDTRHLFYCDREMCSPSKRVEVTAGKPRKSHPEFLVWTLFQYRTPTHRLHYRQKRAVLLWYRYGKKADDACDMLRKRSDKDSQPMSANTMRRHLRSARKALNLGGDVWNYALEVFVQTHPEEFGPFPDEEFPLDADANDHGN